MAEELNVVNEITSEARYNGNRVVNWIAGISLTFVGVYIIAITFLHIPAENVRFADTVLGFLLGTVAGTILTYFFGSSRSSQMKDDVIHRITNAEN